MKQRKLSIILCFAVLFCCGIRSLAQQSYTLSGLSELQSFTAVTSPKETVVNLTIVQPKGSTDIPEAEIVKVAGRVNKITGTLQLEGLSKLTTTVGLINVIDCSEAGFVFKNCQSLVNMDAFFTAGITTINGNFIIENCPNVATGYTSGYTGKSFSKIVTVKGDFKLQDIESRMGENTLPDLTTVEGNFIVDNCRYVAAFTGMPLKKIGGNLILTNNTRLVTLSGFENLEQIGGNVRILTNGSIPNNSSENVGYCRIKYFRNIGIISPDATIEVGNSTTPVDFDGISMCPVEIAEEINGTFRAVPTEIFLRSIGVNTSVASRGEVLDSTINCTKYIGARWIRAALGADSYFPKATYTRLRNEANLRFSAGLGTGGNQFRINSVISNARAIIENFGPDALIAIEGNNEPNGNGWHVTYEGEVGGGHVARDNWVPIAKMQAELYRRVKEDDILGTNKHNIPVWNLSQNGSCGQNVGVQYLVIPDTITNLPMPAGTKYADYTNIHNYFVHGNFVNKNNQTWRAADPSASCPIDGLFGHHGITWNKKYKGYPELEVINLPRVSTETGSTISDDKITEEFQGLMYISTYLSQFKRGWEYTAMYILRDRSDESGNQSFGFYDKYYNPRLSAHYLHRFTTILADTKLFNNPGELTYSIPNTPVTVHDLLLQRSDSKFQLVVWSEKYEGGSDDITVEFDKTYNEIKVYNPIVSTEPIQTLKNTKSVPLTMTNHPYIIELDGEFGPVSAQTIPEKQRIVYINPQQQTLYISDTSDVKGIEIFDLTGKCVWRTNSVGGHQTTIDTQLYNTGIYLVRIMNNNYSAETHKVILN